jgi:hypothetical protein
LATPFASLIRRVAQFCVLAAGRGRGAKVVGAWMGSVCVQDIALKCEGLYPGCYRDSVVPACEFDDGAHVRNAVAEGEGGDWLCWRQ